MDFLSQLIKMVQGSSASPQGRDNPGYIPLQNSGFGGKGHVANLQPARNVSRQSARPVAHAPQMTPSQRDFPGRTNYGVPEDNMIDTPQGYVTPQQYDKMMNLRTANMRHGDVLIPNHTQEDLIRRLTMRPQPLYKKYEDGAQVMGGQFRPAYDSIDDFTGPRY